MSTEPEPAAEPAVPRRLAPLVAGSANEKVANLLARLIGDDPRCAMTALIILIGLQSYLDSGDAAASAVYWEPLIVARDLKRQWGGQAYRKAVEISAAHLGQDEDNTRLYTNVCQILIGDPEQEKIVVDRK